MKRIWIYLDNPINSSKMKSFRLALRVSAYHFNALTANAATDPLAAAKLIIYTPINKALVDAYNAWFAQVGLQQGLTLALMNLINDLAADKVGFWDSSVQVVHADNTPRYKAIFPNGRKPFQTSSQTLRISAVKALSIAIGAEVALAAVKADVDAFYTNINDANTSQKASKNITIDLSDNTEAARLAMTIAQYSDLGAFIEKYAQDTTAIEKFFDLEALRKGQQVLFTGQVAFNTARTIVKRTFDATVQLKLENPGVTELKFYFAAAKRAMPGATFVTLAPGTQQTVLVTALGSLADHYLTVYNASPINKGNFVVEVM